MEAVLDALQKVDQAEQNKIEARQKQDRRQAAMKADGS